jgi:hypothetical protein
MAMGKTTTGAKGIVTVGVLLALGGCGSSSGSPSDKTDSAASGCAPATGTSNSGTTTVGTFGWRDNGTLQCATFVLTGHETGTTTDAFQVDTATASTGIDMTMSSYDGPLSGPYSCQTGNGTTQPNILMEITGLARRGIAQASSCTITIGFTTDSGGVQHAQGTFSGTATGDGGTDEITDGMFDVTVPQQGG